MFGGPGENMALLKGEQTVDFLGKDEGRLKRKKRATGYLEGDGSFLRGGADGATNFFVGRTVQGGK